MLGRISAKAPATAATAEAVIATLWNPHATARVVVTEVWLTNIAATACEFSIRRATARGTAGSTVTIAREHDSDDGIISPAGLLLDLSSYSVQPTLMGASSQSSSIVRGQLAGVIGASVMVVLPERVEIPPGNGLSICNAVAVLNGITLVTFAWFE